MMVKNISEKKVKEYLEKNTEHIQLTSMGYEIGSYYWGFGMIEAAYIKPNDSSDCIKKSYPFEC